ncbi:DUF6382 domain-containing protein [Coprococcus eutactus]|jgi:hypothetical protein|uniref:FHA domain-containing protein n=1 Tax=Coprococcus eutactus TaxID=33043 RepID=A0A412ISI7_9FIRM|nr:DUF6382 domain-containing protein [Coprococcus eutactus]EDP26838.1 FHA domain protein [Coprococcus eutactus ATCC 27759]RGS43063.1 FHA domain-containing protein [Coprococcus eutactus]UEA78637.1 FHA domain-containing protein [Coprococcus eutactus ATCC 27759]UWP16976.1 FHA domain-containing protein [Coprococcus eutactus]
MRKVSFKVRNIGSEKYLSYILNDDCEFDEELLDYLEENKIPELIDIIYEEDDENDYLTYNVTGRTTVDALLSNTVNAEKILGIVRGVASGIVNLRDLGIPASYVILHKGFTYVNPVTYDVGMLCVPVEADANINAEFRTFVKDILTSVKYDDSEDCNYVARLLNLLNTDKFTVRNFYSQLTELMESAGMQVEEKFLDIDGDISVSQSTVDTSPDTSMDDLPEYKDVSFGEDDDSEEEDDTVADVDSLFKDLTFDDSEKQEEGKSVSDGIDMSVFDDSVFDDLETENVDDDSDYTEALTSDVEVPEPQEPKTQSSLTEVAQTTDGVMEVELERQEEQIPVLISTDEVMDNPPVVKNIKINRAKIIQKAVVDAEESRIDNPTEQITAPQYMNGEAVEPETNMDPVTSKVETEEKKGTGSTVELTGGMNVVKDSDSEVAAAVSKGVPKAMPYIVRVNTGERVMINKAVFKIGKAGRGVDYHVGGNGAISKVHIIIYQREDGCYLKDNKTTNGTYLNGQRLDDNGEMKLSNDAMISIGGEDFIFKLS